MPRKPKKSGRITLRVPPELHAEIAVVAEMACLDLNGLLLSMIREALPAWRARVQRAAEETLRAQEAMARLKASLRYRKAADVFGEPEWETLLGIWRALRDEELAGDAQQDR